MTRLRSARYEQVWVAYFDHARSILSFERLSSGGRHGAALDPRGVVRRALALNARRIVLVHNHPSGPSTPSWPDVLSTGVVDAACNLFEIALDDHLIVSRHGIASMRRLGMIRAQTVD